MNLDERLDDILAGLSNYIVESIHLRPTPVEMKKINQEQTKEAIKQLIDESLQAELISLINDGEKKVYERIFDRIKELQND